MQHEDTGRNVETKVLLEIAGVKWDNAREKSLELLSAWITFLKANPFPPYVVHHPDSGAYGVGRDFSAPIPALLTVIAGEIAHNLWSAVSNLTNIADCHGHPLSANEKRSLHYVTARTRREMAEKVEDIRQLLSDPVMALMERNQAFNGAPSLPLLHGFNRNDKHSGVYIARPAAPPPLLSMQQFFVSAQGATPVAVEPLLDEWTPLEGPTELVRVTFPPQVADPQVQVVGTPALHLVFGPLNKQIEYIGGMAMIEDVGRIIAEFTELLT
jgi:hypothetical protein